jgi:two-component system, chemotaxis family, protein-glutamate methylesterase/glutaminase
MPPIRILVVDDSSVIRKVLCDALASDPDVEVVGTASDGRIALAKLSQLHPDLVTLDVEMPNMSGLETIKEIRKLYPKLPIIMVSTLTERGASTTLDALALGASDYVTKPSNTGSLGVTIERIKQDLLPKAKALCAKRKPADNLALKLPPGVEKTTPSPSRSPSRIDILAIGTSTGGPNALAQLLPGIPADFPAPIVIVQHMPPLFTRLLAERLGKQTAIQVHEGEAGQKLQPGQAWIAPGDHHMTVERAGTSVQLALDRKPHENSCRPAVDPLFRSVAKTFGPNVLAVVLTGMGYDGVNGAQHIRETGGQVCVQDEATSVVWGMPGQVAAAGLADGIYPIQLLAQEIVRRAAYGRRLVPAAHPQSAAVGYASSRESSGSGS